jgi:hypothetical protein
MATAARFRVDPRLAALLGEGYRSSEHALRELIDNAWDADAPNVWVTLPAGLTAEPVIIQDDGNGMTEAEVRRDYLAVARSRQSRKGDYTMGLRRLVKGRKGIGKFAGLSVADVMTVDTRCRGTRTRLIIRKDDLLARGPAAGDGAHAGGAGGAADGISQSDLEAIDLPLEVTNCDPEEHGTRIILEGLSQQFDPPTPERFKPILMLEYGRQQDFTILVNGEPIGVEDIPGQAYSFEEVLPDVGPTRLRFTVSDGKRALRQSGIALRAAGKIIGRPMTFGLDDDEEVPPKLLKKVYGEVEADGLVDSATADWGDVVETRAFHAVSGWAAMHLKRALNEVFATEMQLARARLKQDIMRRLAQLPEHRRPFAEQRIQRVLSSLYGEREDRVEAVVAVALDAMEVDAYYAVVEAINASPKNDVAVFAAALGDFGFADMAHMADQARNRLAFLDRLDELIGNPATREQEVHVALEHNLWVLGPQYALMASNKTLRRVIEEYTGAKYGGERAAERPDLLLLDSLLGKRVLIEFKRPSVEITREHEAQAATYRDELVTKFPGGMDVLLIGRGALRGSDRTWVPPGLTVVSYAEVVSKARNEVSWLLERLRSESPDVDEVPLLAPLETA